MYCQSQVVYRIIFSYFKVNRIGLESIVARMETATASRQILRWKFLWKETPKKIENKMIGLGWTMWKSTKINQRVELEMRL